MSTKKVISVTGKGAVCATSIVTQGVVEVPRVACLLVGATGEAIALAGLALCVGGKFTSTIAMVGNVSLLHAQQGISGYSDHLCGRLDKWSKALVAKKAAAKASVPASKDVVDVTPAAPKKAKAKKAPVAPPAAIPATA